MGKKKKKKKRNLDELVRKMTNAEYETLLDEVALEVGGGYAKKSTQPIIDERFSEKRVGLTLSGGTYSIAFYYNNEGEPCLKEEATSIHIMEFDGKDRRINEVYADI